MFEGMNYIITVYEEGSFSKAAQKLYISQPSLSASVRKEEERIGYPVFDRSTRPLSLTEYGEEYINSAYRIISVEKQFEEKVEDIGELKKGELKIGGSALFSSWILPPLIGSFVSKYPYLTVELIEGSSHELKDSLFAGKIDLMMDNMGYDEELFSSTKYKDEYLLLAVPKNFAENKGMSKYRIPIQQIKNGTFLKEKYEAVPLEHFENCPFVLMKPDNDTRGKADYIFKKYKINPSVVFEVDQQMTSYTITSSGLGASFISDTLISRVPFHDEVCFYKLPLKYASRSLRFYYRKNRYMTRAMNAFLETL